MPASWASTAPRGCRGRSGAQPGYLVVDGAGRSYLAAPKPDDELVLGSAVDLATGGPVDVPPPEGTTTWRAGASWFTTERSDSVPQVGTMHFSYTDLTGSVHGLEGDVERWSTTGPQGNLGEPVIAGDGVVASHRAARDLSAGYDMLHAFDVVTGAHRLGPYPLATGDDGEVYINQERWMVA